MDLIKVLKNELAYDKIVYNPESNQDQFTIIDYFEAYSVFNVVNWKDVIKYTLTDSKQIKAMKLGKIFKESPNSIYDFIKADIDFGQLNPTYTSRHGIMILHVNQTKIYCYYKVDCDGCATCGMDSNYENPSELVLYMGLNVEDLVNQCMSLREQSKARKYLGCY